MLNLKKKNTKLLVCLIFSSIIFVWWWFRPTLIDYKNCNNYENFDGHDGRHNMEDVKPEWDSPFTSPPPPPPAKDSNNPGKKGQPGDMSAIEWDPYIHKAPKTVAEWDRDGVEGDGTRHMSQKYLKQFDKYEENGVKDLEKQEKGGMKKTLCSRPVSLAGMNAFNVCPAIKNSTTCGNWDSDWDYWCRRELGNEQSKEFSQDNPSHEVWGRKYKYEGGCNNNPFNPWTAIFGGNGRAVCGKGWSDGKPMRPYSTSCQLWTDIGFTEFSQRMCTDTYETATGPKGKKKVSLGTKPEHGPDWKNPSQELWGKASRYNGGCMDGQGRVQCAKGWSDGVKLVPFSTACEEPNTAGGGIGEVYGHQLNTDCARYNKIKCPDAGLTADKCWGVKKVYTGKGGCPDSLLDMRNGIMATVGAGGAGWALGGPIGGLLVAGITAGAMANRKLRRAACGVGFYNGVKLPENTTPCKRWSTIDDIDCRYFAGGKIKTTTDKNGKITKKRILQPCNYSKDNLPQDVWGVKKRIGYGDKVCNYGNGRAICAKGYSGGVKVHPYSSNCYGWTDSADSMCFKTYGSGWVADTDAHKKYKNVWKSGKYNGGCPRTSWSAEDAFAFAMKFASFGASGSFGGKKSCTNRNWCTWGCGRAVCKKDTTPIGGIRTAWFGTNGKTMGDTLAGTTECGSRVGFNPRYICKDAFGDEYDFVQEKGCAWLGVGTKARCRRARGDTNPFPPPPTKAPTPAPTPVPIQSESVNTKPPKLDTKKPSKTTTSEVSKKTTEKK